MTPLSPRGFQLRSPNLILAVLMLMLYAVALRWGMTGKLSPGMGFPDSHEYAYGALALLRGVYPGEWDGPSWRPHYPPGFSLLLVPAVALGGLDGATWVPYLAALALGAIGAGLAARLGGQRAAPLAVVLLLAPAWSRVLGREVLSDMPAAALVLLEVALLAYGRGRASKLAAGAVGGALVCVRNAHAPLLLAGLAGVSALPDRRRAAIAYALGAAGPLLLLAAWQWVSFGAPWATSYDSSTHIVYDTGRTVPRDAWFGLQYLAGLPAFREPRPLIPWTLPNAVAYGLDLLGVEQGLVLPGVGLLGAVGLWRLAREQGAAGAVGRFGLAALPATLAVALPYHYQHPRLVLVPATLFSVAAAAMVSRWLEARGKKTRNAGALALTSQQGLTPARVDGP